MSKTIPTCMTPRPGESVIYYKNSARFEGIFHGYNANDDLLIRNSSHGITKIDNYIKVRIANPLNRSDGCWCQVHEDNIRHADDSEKEKISKLLNEIIPPGFTYFQFIEEIWSRGYEVFLVGGSVRDSLNDGKVSDVDIVTTIPFFLLGPIAESIFGTSGYSRARPNGFMSVGKGAANRNRGDITFDVKNFFLHAPSTEDAEFGSNIELDKSFRDFACNAVYYDPINNLIIDPSGIGVRDAKGKILNLVNDPNLEHPTLKKAHIAMRYFKFLMRGYTPSEECADSMRNIYKPLLSGIGTTQIIALFYRTIFSKLLPEQRAERFWLAKSTMRAHGFSDIWDAHLVGLEKKFGARR